MFVVKNVVKYWCYTNLNNTTFYYVDENTRSQLYSKSAPAATSVDEFSGTSYILVSADESILTLENNKSGESIEFERYSSGDLISTETLKTYAITKRYIKHKAGEFNSYSYGVTGSPTVSADGLASGFSTANYLTTPEFPTGVTNLETVWKVKLSSFSSNQYFFNTAPYHSLLLGMNDSKFRFWISNNTTSWDISGGSTGTTTLTANTWYYVKFTYDGSTYRLYTSTDNDTWTLEASLSSTKTIGVNYATGRIGHGWTDAPANNTTVDLRESYIKINGEYWWSGFYPEDVTGYKHYSIMKTGVIHKAGEFKRDFNVVGSPTISNDGVVSGFSTSNYIQLPSLFRPGSSPWERVVCFTTGSDVSPAQMITFFNPVEDTTKTGGGFLSVYQGKVYMSLSSNNTSWNIVNDNVSNTTLSPNTTYYVKLKFTGTEYQKWLSITGEFNGEETLENTVVSSTPIYQESTLYDRFGFRMSGLPQVFSGSIDLSKSYIKINSEFWWTGFYAEDVYGEKYY